MATNSAEVRALLCNVLEAQKDTDRKFQDTERLLKEQSQNTDRLLKEQSGATDRRIRPVNDQSGKLGNRLGEFIEGLVKPAVVRLFREQGVEAHKVYGDISVSRADGGIEINLRVVNDREAVLADVKSTLKDSVVVLNQTPFALNAG